MACTVNGLEVELELYIKNKTTASQTQQQFKTAISKADVALASVHPPKIGERVSLPDFLRGGGVGEADVHRLTWGRMVEKERIEFGCRSWAGIQLAKDRTEWRSFVRALCATGRGKDL